MIATIESQFNTSQSHFNTSPAILLDPEQKSLRVEEFEENFWMPHLFAASAYIEKGMYAEAIAESGKEKELSGGNVMTFSA